MRDLIRVSFVAIIIVSPLIISSATTDAALWPQSVAIALLPVITCALLLAMRDQHRIEYGATPALKLFAIICAALIAIGTLSLYWAVAPSEALPALANLILVGCLAIVTAHCLTVSLLKVSDLAIAAVVGGAVLSAVGLLQYAGIAFGDLPGKVVPYGTQGNKNLLTSAVMLALPLSFYGFVTGPNRRKLAAAVALVLETGLIAASRSRGAWVAIAVMLVLAASLVVRGNSKRRQDSHQRPLRAPWRTATIILCLGILVGVGAHELHKRNVPTIPTQLLNLSTASIEHRLHLWQTTMQMIGEAPLLGQGLGQWKIHAPRFYGDALQRQTTEVSYLRPHNDFLWIASESGIIGLLLTLAIFGLGLGEALRRFARDSGAGQWTALIAFCGLITFAVDSSFSFSRERPALLMYLALYLGVALATDVAPVPGQNSRNRWLSRVAFASILAASLGIAAFFAARLLSDLHTKQAMIALAGKNYDRVVEEARAADRWHSRFDYGAIPLRGYAGFALFESGRYTEAVEELSAAYKLNPYSYAVLNNLAAAHLFGGSYAESGRFYQESLRLWPQADQSLLSYAILNYVTGQFDSAAVYLSRIEAPDSLPRFAQYHRLVTDSLEARTHRKNR